MNKIIQPQDVEPLYVALEPTREGPLDDPHEFVSTLSGVNSALDQAGLPWAFNYAYLKLSRLVVSTATQTDKFNHPDTMIRETTNFGNYWFGPLCNYVDGIRAGGDPWEGTSLSWQQALSPNVATAPPILQFFSGMLSHIKVDLAPSLDQTGVNQKHYEDFEKIQPLIARTTDVLLPYLLPDQLLSRHIARNWLVRYIGDIRRDAWDNSVILGEETDETKRGDFINRLDAAAVRHIIHVNQYGGAALKLAHLLPLHSTALDLSPQNQSVS
jgi:hypothetical protein